MNRSRKSIQRLAFVGLAVVLALLAGQRVQRGAHAAAAWVEGANIVGHTDGSRLRVVRRHYQPPVAAPEGNEDQLEELGAEEPEFRVLPDSLTLPADLDPAVARRIRRAEERIRRAERRVQEAAQRARSQHTTRHE
ncbi:hypothetical protein BH23BAC4_BH23BAC4_01110 [soil metagenome]